MGIIRNDLIPGRKFTLNVVGDCDVVILKHLSREIAIFEDESGLEHSAQITWVLQHWYKYRPALEGEAWYCPVCTDFMKKKSGQIKKICRCSNEMVTIKVVEVR